MRTPRFVFALTLVIATALASVTVAQDKLPAMEEISAPVEAPEAEEEAAAEEEFAEEELAEEGLEEEFADEEDGEEGDDMFEKDERFVSPFLNSNGTVGLQNTAAAWSGLDNTYRIALIASFFSGSDVIRFNDSNTWFAGDVLVEATPINYFSINARIRASSNVNSFGRPEAMLSLGDFIFGLKGFYPVAPGITLGADLNFFFPAAFGDAGLDFEGTSIRPRFLASFDIAELAQNEFYLKSHVNIGYRIDRTYNSVPEGYLPSRVELFAYDVSAYDALEINLGVEYDFPYVSPFLGWNLAIPVNPEDGVCVAQTLPCASDIGFASFPSMLELGVRGEPTENLGLHLGMNIGLTSDDAAQLPVTLPWELVIGAQWTIDPEPKIVEIEVEVEKEVDRTPPEVSLLVTVIDKDTNKPVEGAVVNYPFGGETAQVSDANGVLRTYGFAPGSKISLSISHPRYEQLDVERALPAEPGEVPVTIPLQSAAGGGTVSGGVENDSGKTIANAKITFTGPESANLKSDGEGRFTTELQPGTYNVAVSADGYLTRGRDVVLKADSTLDVAFVLKAKPEEVLVKLRDDKIEIQQKVFFESGKGRIKRKSYGLLEQVAGLLAENPNIKRVEIQGHTDDVGSADFNEELSQKRADAVRTFLVEQGVGEGRMISKGYGEARPILPNTTKRNRSINRRVEFKIVDQ